MSIIKTFFDKVTNSTNIHIFLKLLAIQDSTIFNNIIDLMLRGYIGQTDLMYILSITDTDKEVYLSNIITKIDATTVERTDTILTTEVQEVLDDIDENIIVYTIPVNSLTYLSNISTDIAENFSYSSLTNFISEYTSNVKYKVLTDNDVFDNITNYGNGLFSNSFIPYLNANITYTVDNLDTITNTNNTIPLTIINIILNKFKKNNTTYLSDDNFYKILTKINNQISFSDTNPSFFTELLNYKRYGRYIPRILIELHNGIKNINSGDSYTQSEIQNYLINEINTKIIEFINNTNRSSDIFNYTLSYIEMSCLILSKTDSTIGTGDNTINNIIGSNLTILNDNVNYENITINNYITSLTDLTFWLDSLRDLLLYEHVYSTVGLIISK